MLSLWPQMKPPKNTSVDDNNKLTDGAVEGDSSDEGYSSDEELEPSAPVSQAHDATIKPKDPPNNTGRTSPSSSDHSCPQKHKVRTETPNAQKLTKTASASTVPFYRPGNGSGTYHHIATNLRTSSKRNDDTPCIVQNIEVTSLPMFRKTLRAGNLLMFCLTTIATHVRGS